MILCHLTNRKYERSILRHGLDPKRSRRVRKDTWLFDRHRLDWAIAHVIYRHAWSISDLVLLTVDVPDEWCLRTRVPQCRRCTHKLDRRYILDCRSVMSALREEAMP